MILSLLEKVYSMSAQLQLIADSKLMKGAEGTFGLVDYRSFRLRRVCHPSYSTETCGFEDGVDSSHIIRVQLAEIRGHDLKKESEETVLRWVDYVVVVDARDTHDKIQKVTGSYGAQKSLAFSVASCSRSCTIPFSARFRRILTADAEADLGHALTISELACSAFACGGI